MELVPLTDEELLRRLRDPEDNYVERKPRKQQGEWLQTLVALANSTPIGYPAVFFAGVDDKGNPQDGNSDDIQNVISSLAKNAYPHVYHTCRVILVEGKPVVAVIIPGSAARPHFAAYAYVRVGHQNVPSNEEQFAQLIASRLSKAWALQQYMGKAVSVWSLQKIPTGWALNKPSTDYVIMDCNAHYVTFDEPPTRAMRVTESVPLEWVELSYDHGKNRLALCLTHA